MSVYTQLTDDQFAAFCQSFGVSFARAIPITQGIKNSNWFIQTTDDNAGEYSYVFTLFEERPPADIEKMAVILNQLEGKLPVAAPLAIIESEASNAHTDSDNSSNADNANANANANANNDNDNDNNNNDNNDKRYVIHYEDKAITVVPCLAGEHPKQTTQAMCHEVGVALAMLHETLQVLQPAEDYGVALYPWMEVRDREMQFMPSDEAKLMSDIWQSYSDLPHAKLPKGLCHLDMFADNTLWNLQKGEERLTGLLDFTEVSVDHYVMDIAITINDFCTTWGKAEQSETVDFDRRKMTAFLQGYESKRTLTADEKRALPVMLAKAAVIFWLLRLNVIHYNRIGGRTGDNIMVKNPDLMKRLAAYHWAHVEKAQDVVFVLLSHEKDSIDNANQKIVGVFSSAAQAEQARTRLKAGSQFEIKEFTLDQLT